MQDEGERLLDHLKSVRETSFLDLNEISNHLSIPKLYLQAIEEGNFSNLPKKRQLAEKYITSYAEFLEVDAKLILNAYDDFLQQKQNATPSRRGKRSTRSSSKIKPFWYTYRYYILSFGACIILAFVIWLFVPSNKSESISSKQVQNSSPIMTVNKERPVFSLQKTSTDSTIDQTWFISQADSIHVQIKPLGKVSFRIHEDSIKGKIIADKELSKSESFDLNGKKWLFIHFDNPSQVLMKVNDVVIDTTSQTSKTTYEFKIASN
jgi:cytoskeletal protein RodZ